MKNVASYTLAANLNDTIIFLSSDISLRGLRA